MTVGRKYRRDAECAEIIYFAQSGDDDWAKISWAKSVFNSFRQGIFLFVAVSRQAKNAPPRRPLRLRGEEKIRLLGGKFLEDSRHGLIDFLLSGLLAGGRVYHICRRSTPEELPCLGIDNIKD